MNAEVKTSATATVPAASVILPVFNAGKYLRVAIQSVLAQTFQNFELLLLNDGSTDGSLVILNEFANLDARCKVYSWPNQGLIATLNEGIRLASAKIIFRMDADDICNPERFQKQIDYLSAHPDCVAVGSRVMLIDPEGLPICSFVRDLTHEAIDVSHMNGRGTAMTHPAVAFRKDAVVSVGGYRVEFLHAEDIDLFLRLAEFGRLANLPNVLLDYRQHVGSIGYQYAAKQQESLRRAVLQAHHRRGYAKDVVIDRGADVGRVTLADVHRKWSWWALSGGNVATARKHALYALRSSPFDSKNLKLLACVIRGY